MSPKFTYHIEYLVCGVWRPVIRDTRDYCAGYFAASRYNCPRNAMRLVRSDGKILDQVDEFADVSIGLVAGFPTAEQYEQAAARALERAREIRDVEARRASR